MVVRWGRGCEMSEPHPPGAIAHLRSVLDGSCNVRLKVHHDREDIEVCADDPEVLDWVGYCVPRGLTEWKRKIQDEGPFTWEDEDKYIITGDGRAALWKHTITS